MKAPQVLMPRWRLSTEAIEAYSLVAYLLCYSDSNSLEMIAVIVAKST